MFRFFFSLCSALEEAKSTKADNLKTEEGSDEDSAKAPAADAILELERDTLKPSGIFSVEVQLLPRYRRALELAAFFYMDSAAQT